MTCSDGTKETYVHRSIELDDAIDHIHCVLHLTQLGMSYSHHWRIHPSIVLICSTILIDLQSKTIPDTRSYPPYGIYYEHHHIDSLLDANRLFPSLPAHLVVASKPMVDCAPVYSDPHIRICSSQKSVR